MFIDKNTEFVIYGVGEIGNICYQLLRQNGYEIVYGLDKKKSGEGLLPNVYTYILGEEPKELARGKYVVVICLANGLLHKDVADNLYKSGYRYIVFLPIAHSIDDHTKGRLTANYNAILECNSDVVGIELHDYSRYKKFEFSTNGSLLRENDGEYTVFCGIEMLYSESIELWTGDKNKVFIQLKYEDRSIAMMHPCKVLFDYLGSKRIDCNLYFESKKKEPDENEKKEELIAREELYYIFKAEHNKGMHFFIDSAPKAVWNPKNYWNLVGGHHRTLYLLHEGHTVFPIKVRKADFETWVNAAALKNIVNYLNEKKITRLYAPIPHPAFLNFMSKYENGGKTELESILSFLADYDCSELSILDSLNDEGYFARVFDRIGVRRVLFYNREKEQRELALLLGKLLYRLNDDNIVEHLSNNERFDIILCEEKDVEQYRKICNHFMFVYRIAYACKKEAGQVIFSEYRDATIRTIKVMDMRS